MRKPHVAVSTLVASRWRKEVAADLIEVAGYIAQGVALIGAPVIDGEESELTNPYGLLICLVSPDGELVHTHNLRSKTDQQRATYAIHDAFDPDSATRRVRWEAEIQAKQDAYDALPYPCERGGHCSDRFATERGRATHYRAAARHGERDWRHQPAMVLEPRLPPRPSVVRDEGEEA